VNPTILQRARLACRRAFSSKVTCLHRAGYANRWAALAQKENLMLKKLRLMETCPKCNQGLGVALNRYFYADVPCTDFEFPCPNCGVLLEIEVVAQPIFYCTEAAQPGHAPDAAIASAEPM
jgi:hypothetical protein